MAFLFVPGKVKSDCVLFLRLNERIQKWRYPPHFSKKKTAQFPRETKCLCNNPSATSTSSLHPTSLPFQEPHCPRRSQPQHHARNLHPMSPERNNLSTMARWRSPASGRIPPRAIVGGCLGLVSRADSARRSVVGIRRFAGSVRS